MHPKPLKRLWQHHQAVYMYLLILLVLAMATWPLDTSAASRPRIAKPGCKDHCGNVSIPYPFGIGPNCYHNPWFDIECINNSDSFKLKSLVDNIQGIQINYDPVKEERNLISVVPCYRICEAEGNPRTLVFGNSNNLTGSPFLFSSKRNVLLVNGCGGGVVLLDKNNETIAGCAAVCINNSKQQAVDCYGIGCCQTSISMSVDYYSFQVSSMGNNRIVNDTCTRAVLVDNDWIANKSKNLEHFQNICDPAHVVLEWRIGDLAVNSPSYANSSCVKKGANVHDGGGYVCRCKSEFYQGNPYLPNGCQVVRGCEGCVQECISLGNNTFGCPQKPEKVNPTTLAVGLGLGISVGLVIALVGVYWLYHLHKRRRNNRIKATNFERNGGLLLKQQMSSVDNNVEKTRMLTSDELEKATDQYNVNRIVGEGGQGTVYKGMLSDGKLVAIKKSKKVDESQLKVFINELVILSQINHRNVVKLIGCCLETEVPMLVYEYVSNGTLSENIHVLKEDFPITWEMRLHIATDIANALAYLHSSYQIPIFHRDIKSSNILLDNKYRAKLSDFGISKSVGVDQTHTTTRVVGTFGYLDPGYFQSRQFTDKSDVYSFGVVLIELLSGKKANRLFDDEERGLVVWFVEHMGDSSLYDILDARVKREGREEEIMLFAQLAKRCVNLDAKRRPAMKEVAAELETIRSSLQHDDELLTMNQSISSNERYETQSMCSSIDMNTLDDSIEEQHLFST